MVLSEILQRIQSLYSHGVNSDDTRLSNRHIYNKIISVRADLINKKANKKQDISDWSYSIIPCIKMIQSRDPFLLEAGITGGSLMRSEDKLPNIISDMTNPLVKGVRSLSNDQISSINFGRVNWETLKYTKGNKYAKTLPGYFIKDDYLYLVYSNSTEVSVNAVFEDPFEVLLFPNKCNCEIEESCISFNDLRFKIDSDLIETLINICKEELVKEILQVPEDQSNDSDDSNAKSIN